MDNSVWTRIQCWFLQNKTAFVFKKSLRLGEEEETPDDTHLQIQWTETLYCPMSMQKQRMSPGQEEATGERGIPPTQVWTPRDTWVNVSGNLHGVRKLYSVILPTLAYYYYYFKCTLAYDRHIWKLKKAEQWRVRAVEINSMKSCFGNNINRWNEKWRDLKWQRR